MSSNGNSSTELEILALKLTFINTCVQLAASTIIFHEHMMTLSDEVNLIWGCKATGATVIFLFNRYLVLVLGVTIVLQTVPWDTPSCETTIMLYDIVNLLLNIVITVFSALRAFAISAYKWFSAGIVFLLAFLSVIVGIFFVAESSYAYALRIDHMPICDYTDYYSLTTFERLIIISRTCAIASDVIVIALTWFNTYKTRQVSQGSIRTPFTTLLARDGTLYFLSLVVLNILQMALKSVGGAMTNYISDFVAPVSSILISRLLINLRHVYYKRSVGLAASVIGNLGASPSDGFSLSSGSSGDPGTRIGMLEFADSDLDATDQDELPDGEEAIELSHMPSDIV